MTTCCTAKDKPDYPAKAICPRNGQSYRRVARKTLLHHLSKPWQRDIPEQGYYFCDSSDCEVVYFGEDTRTFTQTDLRTPVGQKSQQPERTLCYCFDVTLQDIVDNTSARNYVIDQTRGGTCDCEIRNPSGRCCLRDFPKENS